MDPEVIKKGGKMDKLKVMRLTKNYDAVFNSMKGFNIKKVVS